MKNFLIDSLAILACTLIFTGCNTASGEAYFNAKVLQVNQGTVHVTCLESFNSGISVDDEVSVPTDVVSARGVPDMKADDNVRIVFDGKVMETSPLQLGTVYAIYLLDENGEAISND